MTGIRLGKRERAALNAAVNERRDHVKAIVSFNLSTPRDPRSSLSKGGSSDSVSNLMGKTHTQFRDPLHNARVKKEIAFCGMSLGRVEARGAWHKQAPLPTDHGVLLTLKRGDKVQPVTDAVDKAQRPFYATSKPTQRFGKTK